MAEKENWLQSVTADKEEIRRLKRELSRAVIARDQAVMERDRLYEELAQTRESRTYRLARGLTFLPRKLREYRYGHGGLPAYQTSWPCMISVVIAVYNTAGFLGEMIESILAQKQDVLASYLRKNGKAVYRGTVYDSIYEIILVDDGSDDGSEDLCDRYAAKYPWIRVLHKENGGVSSARNAGMEIARGKYITFPDSDDKLSENVLEDCFLFFESHERELSMVTYPLRFFDGQKGDHWTCYRFEEGTRILDMRKEWDKPQYFTAASFFKTASVRGKLLFDSRLSNGEDIKFAHEVLCQEAPVVGLVGSCTYWYRRRSTGQQSAIQKSRMTEEYYLPYLKEMLGGLFRMAADTYGEIPKYVQYAVMGQLQWRLRSDGSGETGEAVIGAEGFSAYREEIKKLVRRIDLDVILGQRQLFREHLFYLCRIKAGDALERRYDGKDIAYFFDGAYCTDAGGCFLKLEFMAIENGMLCLEGLSANLEPGCENWLLAGGEKLPADRYARRDADEKILGETALYVEPFRVRIPLTDSVREDIFFGSTVAGMDVVKTRIVLGKFMPISNALSKSYYAEGDWAVRLEENKLCVWHLASAVKLPDFEQEFEAQILGGRYGKKPEVLAALALRKQALSRRAWKGDRKQIWLISDRYSVADDNGEAFFLYLLQRNEPWIEAYFVIDGDSEDFRRLSGLGRVVAQDSPEHILLHLTADCIVSSQADEYIIDPVWRQDFVKYVYRDLYCRKKYVFLQHGVIKDDLSTWLNRYNKKIDGFICSAFREAESVRTCNYYYEKEVWLTGLPRYDRLYHDEKKYICVMPTWRKWLMGDFDAAASDKNATCVRDDFAETEFFKFYQALLTHGALLEACERWGYTLCFMPHSNLRGSMGLFQRDERVIFFGFDKKYREVFAESDLLITDYSSTAMDFAYLRKPVVYAQFDRERFFSGEHTYQKGYFDYEEDGFGAVVYDLDSLVEEVISCMERGCVLEEKYRERIDTFFAFRDRENCRRVYEKMEGLMRGGQGAVFL